MLMKAVFIAATFLVPLALAWDEDATVEDGNSYKMHAKYEHENDGIVHRIMSTLNRFERKLDGFEKRFNNTLEDLTKTTTTTTTSAPCYGRSCFNQGRWSGGYAWTQWVPPTSTMSPQEKCTQAKDFLCYNTNPVCVDKKKRCDGVKDCTDGSDELFCKPHSPENLQPNPKCPNGFVGSTTLNKCYHFSLEKQINWLSALVDCVKRYDGRLAAIQSRVEQEALVRHIKADESWVNASFWIGATNILRNNTDTWWSLYSNPNINKQWSWIPTRLGQPALSFAEVGFSYWKEFQPDNNMGNEFCLEMWSEWDWKWNDVQCHKLRYYICEVPLGTK